MTEAKLKQLEAKLARKTEEATKAREKAAALSGEKKAIEEQIRDGRKALREAKAAAKSKVPPKVAARAGNQTATNAERN